MFSGEEGFAGKAAESVVEARRRLVLEHRLIGRQMAKALLKQWRAYVEQEELASLTDLALCEAAAGFDPRVGTKFSTWFFYHLKGRLVRELSGRGAGLRLRVTADGERRQTISLEDMNETDAAFSHSTPELTCSSRAEGGCYRLRPDEMFYKKQAWVLSRRAIADLAGVEKRLIQLLYQEGKTLHDVAQELGYSRGHLSRLHHKALLRVRRRLSPDHDGMKPQRHLDKALKTQHIGA